MDYLYYLAIVLIVVFAILLIVSVYMLINFFVCDNRNCQVFRQNTLSDPPTSEELINLLLASANQSFWSIAYIAAFLVTVVFLVLVRINEFTNGVFTLLTFFLIAFLIFYSLLSFLFHHYFYPIQLSLVQTINSAS